jgi:hypothetical protein
LRWPEKRRWAGREIGRCTVPASLPPLTYLDIELRNRDLRVLQHGARVSRAGGKADERGGGGDGQTSHEHGELERREERWGRAAAEREGDGRERERGEASLRGERRRDAEWWAERT